MTLSASDFGFSQPGGETDTLDGVRIDTLPGSGSLELNGSAVNASDVISQVDIDNNNLTYVPPANANGAGFTDFTFSVRDDRGAFDTAPNTLTIDVDPVNDPPSATPSQDFTINEDDGTQTTSNFMESLDEGGGSDEDSQTMSVRRYDSVADGGWLHGDAELLRWPRPTLTRRDDGDNTLQFTPSDILAAGEFETVTVTVGVTDSGGTSNGGRRHRRRSSTLAHRYHRRERPADAGQRPQPDQINDDGETITDSGCSRQLLGRGRQPTR
ncbi:MAG: Ig-like domain-containing protein [Halofilum sp. (in: g-proteobacteria)]|nr:Ig-like domain-containing protein [Halofilum sp. (in: g-proteobacteria)]